MHPLAAPFASFKPAQSRLARLSVFVLQLNLVITGLFYYLGQCTQQTDESALKEAFVAKSFFLSMLGSIFMLPILSAPLCCLCANKVKTSVDNKLKVVKRRVLLRALLIALATLSCICVPVYAGYLSMHMNDQSLCFMLAAVIGSCVWGITVPNLIWIGLQSLFAQSRLTKCIASGTAL